MPRALVYLCRLPGSPSTFLSSHPIYPSFCYTLFSKLKPAFSKLSSTRVKRSTKKRTFLYKLSESVKIHRLNTLLFLICCCPQNLRSLRSPVFSLRIFGQSCSKFAAFGCLAVCKAARAFNFPLLLRLNNVRIKTYLCKLSQTKNEEENNKFCTSKKKKN